MDALLDRLYNDPLTGFISASKLYQKARKIDSHITMRAVNDWYASQAEIQEHTEQRARFDDFRIASYNPDSWQLDLAFWGDIAKQAILTAININSRLGYARIMPDKRMDTTVAALKHFIDETGAREITTDNGREFLNHKVSQLFKDHSIEHYTNEAGEHTTMGKIERFNRTIKQRLIRMRRKLTPQLLGAVIHNYNNTHHAAINATPEEMRGQVVKADNIHNSKLLRTVDNAFHEGESVRYRLKHSTFGKESTKWSKTVFSIVGMDGYKVKIRSANGQLKYVSPNDLKLVDAQASTSPHKPGDLFEAEKILDHRTTRAGNRKYLVKWVGYAEPTWEPQANLRLRNKNKPSKLEQIYNAEIKSH